LKEQEWQGDNSGGDFLDNDACNNREEGKKEARKKKMKEGKRRRTRRTRTRREGKKNVPGGGCGESQALTTIVGSLSPFLNLEGSGTSGGSHASREVLDKKGCGVQSRPPFLFFIFLQIFKPRAQV
jgi:hypothetical protein